MKAIIFRFASFLPFIILICFFVTITTFAHPEQPLYENECHSISAERFHFVLAWSIIFIFGFSFLLLFFFRRLFQPFPPFFKTLLFSCVFNIISSIVFFSFLVNKVTNLTVATFLVRVSWLIVEISFTALTLNQLTRNKYDIVVDISLFVSLVLTFVSCVVHDSTTMLITWIISQVFTLFALLFVLRHVRPSQSKGDRQQWFSQFSLCYVVLIFAEASTLLILLDLLVNNRQPSGPSFYGFLDFELFLFWLLTTNFIPLLTIGFQISYSLPHNRAIADSSDPISLDDLSTSFLFQYANEAPKSHGIIRKYSCLKRIEMYIGDRIIPLYLIVGSVLFASWGAHATCMFPISLRPSNAGLGLFLARFGAAPFYFLIPFEILCISYSFQTAMQSTIFGSFVSRPSGLGLTGMHKWVVPFLMTVFVGVHIAGHTILMDKRLEVLPPPTTTAAPLSSKFTDYFQKTSEAKVVNFPAYSYRKIPCTKGVLNHKGDVCCAKSCKKCGGTGCSERPGGMQHCCNHAIRNSNNFCASVEDSSCIVPEIPPGKDSLLCRIDLFPELDDCAEVCARLCYHDTNSPCLGFYIQTRQGKMRCHFRTRTDMSRSCKNCDLYSLPDSVNRTESSLPGAQDFPSWLNDPTQGESSFPQDFQRYLESWDTNDNSPEWLFPWVSGIIVVLLFIFMIATYLSVHFDLLHYDSFINWHKPFTWLAICLLALHGTGPSWDTSVSDPDFGSKNVLPLILGVISAICYLFLYRPHVGTILVALSLIVFSCFMPWPPNDWRGYLGPSMMWISVFFTILIVNVNKLFNKLTSISKTVAIFQLEADSSQHNDHLVIFIPLSGDALSQFQGGDWIMISAPELRLDSWHPFTCIKVSDGVVIHVKVTKSASRLKSWTKRLQTEYLGFHYDQRQRRNSRFSSIESFLLSAYDECPDLSKLGQIHTGLKNGAKLPLQIAGPFFSSFTSDDLGRAKYWILVSLGVGFTGSASVLPKIDPNRTTCFNRSRGRYATYVEGCCKRLNLKLEPRQPSREEFWSKVQREMQLRSEEFQFQVVIIFCGNNSGLRNLHDLRSELTTRNPEFATLRIFSECYG